MLLLPFFLPVLMVQPLTAFRRGEGTTNTYYHLPPVNHQLFNTTRSPATSTPSHALLPATQPLKICTTIRNLLRNLRMLIKTLFPMEEQKSKFLFICLYAKKHRWKTKQKILNKILFPYFFWKLSSDFSKQLAQHRKILICSVTITTNIF